MNSIDLDGNGFVDYSEFLTASMNKEKILSIQNLEAAFNAFDKDGSGKISVDEIQALFTQKESIKKSVFEQILKQGDKNGDGELSFEEFKDLMISFFAN